MGSGPYIGVLAPDLRTNRSISDGSADARLRVFLSRGVETTMTTAFIQGLGPLELAIVLFIVLVLVGGRRLPQLGRQLGDGVREFKDSVTKRTDAQYDDDTREKPAAAALGRPAGEESPVDGEVMRERS